MGFDTALSLAKTHYQKYPGPTKDTYLLAEQVSRFLLARKILEPGVIGVAKSDAKRGNGADMYYVGMSPGIQEQVINVLGGDEAKKKVAAHWALGKALETELGVMFNLCWKVSDRILSSVDFNFGCAEKKLLTGIEFFKEKMTEISVVPHPLNTAVRDLGAHIVVASSEELIIAPCKSCLAVKF